MKLLSDPFGFYIQCICGWGALYATPFAFFPYWREVAVLCPALCGIACRYRESAKKKQKKFKRQVKKRFMKRGKYYVNK